MFKKMLKNCDEDNTKLSCCLESFQGQSLCQIQCNACLLSGFKQFKTSTGATPDKVKRFHIEFFSELSGTVSGASLCSVLQGCLHCAGQQDDTKLNETVTFKVNDIQELIIQSWRKVHMSRILKMITCQGKQDKASQREGHLIWTMKTNYNSRRGR